MSLVWMRSGAKAKFALYREISARPAGKPGISIVSGEFATIPSPPLAFRTSKNILGARYAFSKAWRNLSVRCGFKTKTKPWGGTDRLPLVGPEPR